MACARLRRERSAERLGARLRISSHRRRRREEAVCACAERLGARLRLACVAGSLFERPPSASEGGLSKRDSVQGEEGAQALSRERFGATLVSSLDDFLSDFLKRSLSREKP